MRIFSQLSIDSCSGVPGRNDESDNGSSVLPENFHRRREIRIAGDGNNLVDFATKGITKGVQR